MVAAPLKEKRADLWTNTKPTLNNQPCNERLKVMVTHSSASVRAETPHETETTQITISDVL